METIEFCRFGVTGRDNGGRGQKRFPWPRGHRETAPGDSRERIRFWTCGAGNGETVSVAVEPRSAAHHAPERGNCSVGRGTVSSGPRNGRNGSRGTTGAAHRWEHRRPGESK